MRSFLKWIASIVLVAVVTVLGIAFVSTQGHAPKVNDTKREITTKAEKKSGWDKPVTIGSKEESSEESENDKDKTQDKQEESSEQSSSEEQK